MMRGMTILVASGFLTGRGVGVAGLSDIVKPGSGEDEDGTAVAVAGTGVMDGDSGAVVGMLGSSVGDTRSAGDGSVCRFAADWAADA